MKNKIALRLTSLILVIAFLLPMLCFAAESSDGKPTDLTPIYVDDFSDGVISPHIGKRKFYTSDPGGGH